MILIPCYPRVILQHERLWIRFSTSVASVEALLWSGRVEIKKGTNSISEKNCCLEVTVANRCVHDVNEKNESALFEFTSCKCHSKAVCKKREQNSSELFVQMIGSGCSECSEGVLLRLLLVPEELCNKNPAKNAKAVEENCKERGGMMMHCLCITHSQLMEEKEDMYFCFRIKKQSCSCISNISKLPVSAFCSSLRSISWVKVNECAWLILLPLALVLHSLYVRVCYAALGELEACYWLTYQNKWKELVERTREWLQSLSGSRGMPLGGCVSFLPGVCVQSKDQLLCTVSPGHNICR